MPLGRQERNAAGGGASGLPRWRHPDLLWAIGIREKYGLRPSLLNCPRLNQGLLDMACLLSFLCAYYLLNSQNRNASVGGKRNERQRPLNRHFCTGGSFRPMFKASPFPPSAPLLKHLWSGDTTTQYLPENRCLFHIAGLCFPKHTCMAL